MRKITKKAIALAMAATMLMGSTVVLAAEVTESGADNPTEDSTDAPIFGYEISNVVVPTELKVAFNPDGFEVKTTMNAGETTTDQIVSLNYGIINKSSKAKLLTVDFTVTDKNVVDGEGIITFASTEDEVTNAEKGDYVVYLEAVPGEVTTAVTHETEAAALADVQMTADDTNAVVLGGSGKIGFVLQEAEYTQDEIELGAVTGNDVSDKFTLTGVNAGSYIGFTFAGSMNTNTNWAALENGITIDVVYGWETTDKVDYGVTELVPPVYAPSIADVEYDLVADTALEIAVDLGAGDLAAETGVVNVTYVNATGKVTSLPTTAWSYADGVVTIAAERVNTYIEAAADKVITIVFDDEAGTGIEVTLKVPETP